MKLSLYMGAVLFHPQDETKDTKLVHNNLQLLAKDMESAKIELIREVDPQYPSDQLEVIVRPF